MNKKEKIVKTPEEAIEVIKSNMPTSGYQMLRESLIMAIGVLEKQIPKRIIIKNWNPTLCPTCGHELSTSLGDGYYKYPTFLERCPKCGQSIRWEESEEE